YYRVAHHPHAVRVGDHHRTIKKTEFFHPGGSGHLAVAVQRKPSGINRIAGTFPARETRGHTFSHRAFANYKLSFAFDQRGMADLNSFHVRDRIPRPRRPFKWNTQIARAWL